MTPAYAKVFKTMFEVILIICLIDGNCIRYKDLRGPYYSDSVCEDRLEEMVRSIPRLVAKPWRIYKSECENSGEVYVEAE